MRLLFCSGVPISLSSEIKGGGNWIVQHIKALRKYANKDVEVGVICLDSKVKEFHFFEEDGIFYYNIRSFEGSKVKRVLYSLRLTDVYKNFIADVKQGIEHYRPDIIQIFGYESQFIRLLGHTDIPIVIHFTGFKEAYAAKVDRLKISKLKPKRKGLNKLLGLFINERKNSERVSAIGKVDYKKVSYVFGRTEWDKALTRLISPKAQYFHMEELLRDSFTTLSRKLEFNELNKTREFIFLTVSKNAAYKNIDIIYQVSTILRTYAPHFNFTWRIAGIRSSMSIPRYMERSGHNDPSVIPIGFLSAEGLIEEMNRAHLFILPSAIENSPNALQEAMLFGLPVLASQAGGVNSLIKDGENGFLVNEGDPFAMAARILQIFDDSEKLIRVGENAREKGLTRNNPKNVAEAALNAYKSILKEKHK